MKTFYARRSILKEFKNLWLSLKFILLYNAHVENGFKVPDILPSIIKISNKSKKSQPDLFGIKYNLHTDTWSN